MLLYICSFTTPLVFQETALAIWLIAKEPNASVIAINLNQQV